jgi:type II secretory pathway component PulM
MIQFNARERLLSIGLLIALAGWAAWALAVKPAQDRIRTLKRIIPEKQTQLHAIQTKGIEYAVLENEFKGLRAKMASQDPSFQLLPFLETMIERHKLAGHVVKMRQDIVQPQPDYSETVVTIELQDIALRQLVTLLTAIESSEAVVQVGSLHIRKDTTNDALLDSTVEIYSPRLSTTPATQVAQVP